MTVPGGHRRLAPCLAAVLAGLLLFTTGCSQDDPQASLEAAVQQLQDNLEARDTRAVVGQLDAKFRAQGELDREWARQTMALVFLRHDRVRVLAVSRNSRLDPVSGQIGHSEAQVLLTGAQGLIPDRVAPYAVRMEWRRDGGEWKLRDLRWE